MRHRWVSHILAGALCAPLGCDDDGANGGDDGEPCTFETCQSRMVVTLTHDLPLESAPFQLDIQSPTFTVECSIPSDPAEGTDSCFGFRFTNIEWEPGLVRVILIDPFYDAEINPNDEPFESVEVFLKQGGTVLQNFVVELEHSDPIQPNGSDCPPTCFEAAGAGVLQT